MPFKFHSKGRRHIPRQRHRVTNWREYDASLRNCGSLTMWFTPDAIAGWKAQPRTTPGGQRGNGLAFACREFEPNEGRGGSG